MNIKQPDKKSEKKSWLNPFKNMYTDGKGVDKNEPPMLDKPNLKNYFKFVWRKINVLFSLNMYIILGNFPIYFALFATAGYTSIKSVSPSYSLFSALSGIIQLDKSPVTAALYGVYQKAEEVLIPTKWTYIFFGISLLTIITFGLITLGITYIMKNIVRQKPVFMWSDFWKAIKSNLKQGLIIGILDSLMIVMFIYDWYFFIINLGQTSTTIGLFLTIAMTAFYIMMRPYLYILLTTFEMSTFKIIKNAVLFTYIGIKRNIMAFIGIVAVVTILELLLSVMPPLAIGLILIIVPSILYFSQIYASYPKVKEIMIDPFYKENADDPKTK